MRDSLLKKYVLAVALLFVLTGCGAGGGGGAGAGANQSRAALGPLANARLNIFNISDLNTAIFQTSTDSNGFFSGKITTLSPQSYILISVSGGQDIDANDDGIVDATPTPNTGTIYALSTVSTFNSGNVTVSAVTDIIWRYTKNLIGDVSNAGLQIRLDDLAKTFVAADINGDGVIDIGDVLAFNPQKANHKNNLNFSYQALFVKGIAGESIIDAYHLNNSIKVDSLLDGLFGNRLTRFPVMDSRYKSVKVEVIPFGKGIVSSDTGGISYDPAKSASQNTTSAFYPIDPAKQVAITATPAIGVEVLSWLGCDTVSPDKTQCLVSLSKDRQVEVNFGHINAKIIPNLVDLSRANTTFLNQTVNVTIDHGDSALVTQVAGLSAGDFVVGSGNGGFLEKVISITKVSLYKYAITTVNATLNEVVLQGTGSLSKQMTNGDLAGGAVKILAQKGGVGALVSGTAVTPGAPANAPVAFRGLEGIRVIPSKNPNDNTFLIQLGEPNLINPSFTGGNNLTKTVTLFSGAGVKATATGTIAVNVKLDFFADYDLISLNPGLQEFKFTNELNLKETLDVTVTGKGTVPNTEVILGTLYFNPVRFFIGVVPVWITPQVDIIMGADATISAVANSGVTFRQHIRSGVKYKSGDGWSAVKQFRPSSSFTPPQMTAEGELVGYIKPATSLLIYGYTGPKIYVKGSEILRAKAKANSNIWKDDACTAGLDLSLWAGVGSAFDWNWSAFGDTKLGKLVMTNKGIQKVVPFSLYKKEWKQKEWNLKGKCPVSPPKLEVSGLDLIETVQEQSGAIITQNYTLTNVGDTPLTWQAQYVQDGVVSLSQMKGTLTKGASTVVTATVNTMSITAAGGEYTNTINFINPFVYDPKLMPNYDPGTTSRLVAITATPLLIAPPVALTAALFSPTIVDLTWNYTDAASLPYVKGYRILQSADGITWNAYALATGKKNFTYTASHLLTGKTYYFKVAAYGDNVASAFSAVVSIVIPVIPPTGSCRAHFSGALMADAFLLGWTSEVYVIDGYSEYVGAGLYPNNNLAFPKAVASTFDGIAIDAGTRVTIYSLPNFQGTILYQQVGPAVVNNSIWMNSIAVSNVNSRNWKPALQAVYPQSVRAWSASNMHPWSNGSVAVECGF